jgi:hypothetical protein
MKPKLFFFQACRGDKDMETKNQRPDSGVSTKSGNSTTDHKDDKTSKNNNNTSAKHSASNRDRA